MPFQSNVLSRIYNTPRVPKPYTQPPGMDLASNLARIGVRLVRNLSGVPGMLVLADSIITLIETCESVPKQRSARRTLDTDRITYKVSRQNVRRLRSRCVFLLECLDAEGSKGRPTSKRLEKAISEANE